MNQCLVFRRWRLFLLHFNWINQQNITIPQHCSGSETFLSVQFLRISKTYEFLTLLTISTIWWEVDAHLISPIISCIFPKKNEKFYFFESKFSQSTKGFNFWLGRGQCIFFLFCIFSQKNIKFDFPINENSQDLQKAWISNFACIEHVVGSQQQQQPFYGPLTPLSSLPSSVPLISRLHLRRTNASSLLNFKFFISPSTTSIYLLFGLPQDLTPSVTKSIHFFTHSLSSFLNTWLAFALAILDLMWLLVGCLDCLAPPLTV